MGYYTGGGLLRQDFESLSENIQFAKESFVCVCMCKLYVCVCVCFVSLSVGVGVFM